MKLNVSVAALNRKFSKSVWLIRPAIEELSKLIEAVDVLDPLQTDTLILITDDQEENSIKEVKSDDGIYQVTAGVNPELMGDELKECLREIFIKTIEMSLFTPNDEKKFLDLIDDW